jgi:mRNA degradation ribonuclease J1/J2
MAKNLGRKFATMSEDERRRFALEEEEGTREHPVELDFEEPRDAENMGPQYSSIREEVADPEHRDGMSALLDDEQHERAVQEASKRGAQPDPDAE